MLVILLVLAELVARFVLGLGDPPLLISDPQIEYLFQPSREYRRFGNRIAYNAYSMRSDPMLATRSDPHQRRVLVIGDSIVNGGNRMDQSQLATELLKTQLSSALGLPVAVGNVSAGSWGPANELAYVKKFGIFDADVVVIVLSSHDYGDFPTFQPVVGVNPEFPDRSPWLAVLEALSRYGPKLVKGVFKAISDQDQPDDSPPLQVNIDESLLALREMIDLARQEGAVVMLAQHLERAEAFGTIKPGHDVIKATAKSIGVKTVQLGPAFREALNQGQEPYLDHIHPNELGHQLIGETLFEPIETILKFKPPRRVPSHTDLD